MQTMSSGWGVAVTESARQMEGKVEIYNDSALLFTFLPYDMLQSITVSYEITQPFGWCAGRSATIELLDPDCTVEIPIGAECLVYLGTVVDGAAEYASCCKFYVDTVERSSMTVKISAYDAITAHAAKHTSSEIVLAAPFTAQEYASAIGALIGADVVFDDGLCNNLTYTADMPPNMDGTEKLSEVLGYIAQLTGSGCYVDSNNAIHFRKLGGESVLSITKDDYYDLATGVAVVLTGVTSATDVGDNVTAGDDSGYNFVMYNNPFVDNRSDQADILQAILDQNADIPIQPYTVDWRGNPALDPGDCVILSDYDDSTISVLYLRESALYAGGYNAQASFDIPEQENPSSNPASIGDAINQTRVRVDKVNQRIEFEASRTDGLEGNVAAIAMTTDQISQSVTSIQEDSDGLKTRVAAIENNAEDISLKVQNILDNGVDKVVTETGATLDADGLHVTKSGEEMESRIDYTGLYVERDGEAVLKANNKGVEAENVTVRTYLTIGKNSRFEDYDTNRTGCFYVGGDS